MALFRKACITKGPGRRPSCVRLSSAGMMQQVLEEHRKHGGLEPHQGVTRQDCCKMGAPTRAALKKKKMKRAPGKNRGMMVFMAEKRSRRKRLVGKLSRQDAKQEIVDLAFEFDQQPAEEKERYRQLAAATAVSSQDARYVDESTAEAEVLDAIYDEK
eukprot:11607868-Karenia_brevis.AAC.1